MTDNSWQPDGHKIRIRGTPLLWPQALRSFVLPVRHQPDWIENSRNVTNTGLSAREWFGLILHAIALTDASGENFYVSTENTGGDGAVVNYENGEGMAVLVEQTLATHKENGEFLEIIKRRVDSKSAKGENYAANRHLIVFCNNNGDLIEKELTKVVNEGRFDIVNIIGFAENEQGRHFLSFIFDKDFSEGAIHRMAIKEPELWQAAIDIYDDEQREKALAS